MKKRYKILSIILALAIVLGSIVTISIFSSSAESFTDENGITWTVTKNYPGWAISGVDKTKMVGEVEFPEYYNDELIVAIEGSTGLFSECTGLTSITLPDSIEYIDIRAFSGCTGLTSINFGKGLKTIGDYVFENCTGLTSITIPEGVKNIGTSTFSGCTNLTSVTFPNSLNSFGKDSFRNCKSLTSITIPNNVESIGGFSNCTGLTSITIPDSVKTIEEKAFSGCIGLTSITIPDSVETIGYSAFSNCTGLTSIEIPDNVTSIPKQAFDKCTSLSSVIIPDTVVEIGEAAFSGCTKLTSINIPDGVTTINKNTFYKCTNLASITIPNGVESIGEFAFSECSNLTAIKIPDTVKEVNDRAFYKCTNLSKVDIDKDNIEYIGYSAFPGKTGISPKPNLISATFVDDNNISWELTPYKNEYSIYPTDKSAISGAITIPSSYNNIPITIIEGFAFDGCANLTNVTLPESLKTIQGAAFRGCTGLTSITLPDSIKNVGGFQNCTNLTNINIPEGTTTINSNAFSGCTSLSSITLPNSLTDIGTSSFEDCTNLESIIIPKGVKTIGSSAFMNCKSLTGELNIPDSVVNIDSYCFYNCSNLTSLHIGSGIKVINLSTFDKCTSLSSVTIPDTVEEIDDFAFNMCHKAFTDGITIGKNIRRVGKNAYACCGIIDTLTVETSNTSNIHITAFYADEFRNLVVGETVKEIDSVILSGNKNFASVGLGSNTTISNPYAFYGNSNMTIETTNNATSVIDYATKNNIPYTIVNNVDVTRNVSFEVTCDKPGYEFTVYRVADLEKGSNPYYIRYDSLITDIEDEIFEGNSEALLTELDKVDSSLLTEVVGTYSTDVDGSSKLFEDLPAGIYYVRATNFPANVYSVQNSVFALPYYTAEDGWIYELSPIPLATKVDESNPEIVKTITNSTKDNVNFTDVSLGDTVNFEIEASRVGSANVVESKNFKLNSYVVSDIMESGLTLNQDSFVVTLEDIDGNTLTTLENTTDYVVNIVANEGADTTFTVSLTPEYLAQDEFYSSANVVIAYSAVLNKYATREFDGNYNTATDLTYSNKTNVTSTVEGNTVYAYTFGIEVNKYDDAGTPLAGSEFGLYLTEDDAKVMKNAIATGTSTDTGKVEFFTESNDVIRLASGTYYIVETKSTENYNRYTDVIPVTITAEYSETETNGTYILSAPANGIQLVEVKNSKVVIPNTGGDGAMYRYLIALAFAMLAVTLVVIKKRNTKKATVTK